MDLHLLDLGSVIGGGGKGWTAVISSALAGGTISKITGGKFKNGAISAAFAAAITTSWESAVDPQQSTARNKFMENDRKALNTELENLNNNVSKLKGFTSTDKAAQWLHKNAHQLTVDYYAEVGAEIFLQSDGSFKIGSVVTSYHSETVSIYDSTGSGRAVSYWHSHGTGDPGGNYSVFSDNDISSTKRYTNSYMSHTTFYPARSYLMRLPSGGNNSNSCIVGVTCK